ncbi:hypothetical protein [Oceanisphaera psychrotolerans]|uniref:Uncharacterized protein n=1 Tax=Oceanisphaera psychrotolerans TaxID=1414654 RepID=A0A1J4QD33_9GAMM|nr:hypothetical protein [Oceanisphaera psychrotolerans]OIN07272.1 hypothetical protein BFR47_16605 [Oceanisphaera psychrotolerans]
MRETRPFGQVLLLSGFIFIVLSALLPWWASYRTLLHQEQQINERLSYYISAEQQASLLPGVAALSVGQPLGPDKPAWWFGQVGANHQQMIEQTPVFYRLDTSPATTQWLLLSIPLTLTALLIFTALHRRWRKEDQEQEQYLQSLLLDPEQSQVGSNSPIAQGIVGLHQHYLSQTESLQQQLGEASSVATRTA